MNITESESDIKAKVLEKIRNGGVRARPRAYFAAQIILVALFSFVALALSAFVLSFIIFSSHESGGHLLLGFGQRGVLTFFALFPWIIFIIDITLFIFIEWLLRHFRFGYRTPVLRVLVGVIATVLLGSAVINLTPFHQALLEKTDRGELPVLGMWYKTIHESHAKESVFRGTITSVQGTGFAISHNNNDRDADDGAWTVVAPPGFKTENFAVGDKVYILGNAAEGVIRAYGIKKLRPALHSKK